MPKRAVWAHLCVVHRDQVRDLARRETPAWCVTATQPKRLPTGPQSPRCSLGAACVHTPHTSTSPATRCSAWAASHGAPGIPHGPGQTNHTSRHPRRHVPRPGRHGRPVCHLGLNVRNRLDHLTMHSGMKPIIACPHCGAPAVARTSEQMSPLLRKSWHWCKNRACGHRFASFTEIRYTLSPPAMPRPGVVLPLSRHVQRAALHDLLRSAPVGQDPTPPPAAGPPP